MNPIFDADCRRCPRLAAFLDAVHVEEPSYYCRPVPPFGDPGARLVLVGLAPGMHGANRTGRPFTGDHAGILLYRTLYKFGLASAPERCRGPDSLIDARITNSVMANKRCPLRSGCNTLGRSSQSLRGSPPRFGGDCIGGAARPCLPGAQFLHGLARNTNR
jgi:hypothetical protein